MSVEMETVWSPSPSVEIISDTEEMDEVWAEEVVLEEDGSPAEEYEEKWNVDDVLTLSPSGGVKSLDESLLDCDLASPLDDTTKYILPDSLTAEEDKLLESSFKLMEDLMLLNSTSELEWKKSDERSVVEKAQDLLDDLDKIKEEPFSDWLEEKTELPLLEELRCFDGYNAKTNSLPVGAVPYQPRPMYIPMPHVGQIAPQLATPGLTLLSAASQPNLSDISAHIPQVADIDEHSHVEQPPLTPALIREFESVLHSTLTPPHTPPSYIDLANNQVNENDEVKTKRLNEDELDALINSQVASLYEDKEEKDWSLVASQNSPNSEWGSVSTSPTTEDTSSDSDPDWAPSDYIEDQRREPSKAGRSKRSITTTDERKQRKKEQNKNAATRYRLKKKAEQAGIMSEESVLLEKNISLKEKATELQREIKYLKSLMKDICKAKGLIQ